MKIAFVTTCKGRREHLEQTLPQNMLDNQDAIFVVLDYGAQDGLAEWLQGRPVVVYSYPEAKRYNPSHAKNMAMRCAILEGADVLVTMDADNYAGKGFNSFVDENMNSGTFLCPDFQLIQGLPHGPKRPMRGYAGRLAMRSMDFIKSGGYCETFDTWRGEDIDIITRMRLMGYSERHIPNHYLRTIPHGPELRFREYPHAKKYENKNEFRLIESRTDTVVNYGKLGLGTVYRNGSRKPIRFGPIPTRVFGIGLHKTATTSLHEAFKILGFDSLHWGEGESPLIWYEMQALGRSKTLEKYYALCDLPIPLLYRELDKAYPGSKFVLTVRDDSKWLESVRRLFDRKYNPTRWVWDVYPFTNRIHTVLYGQRYFTPEVFLARYQRHNDEVREYFRNRPNDLLVMNMDKGGEWPALCRFLHVGIPSVPYPVINRTQKRSVITSY